MSEASKNEQLIHGLLDGELDDLRAQEVRTKLANDSQLGQCYQDCVSQREALASLTRFKLPEDFRDRVLQAAQNPVASTTPILADSGPQETVTEVARTSASMARSGRLKWQIAATAILSSAATLLITTFVLPNGKTGHGPLIGRVTERSVETTNNDVFGDPVLADFSDSMLEDEAMAVSALTEPPIEQVWLLEAQDDQSGVKLARTLAANAIQVPVEFASERDHELSDTLDQEINGILIEASAIQMKKALLELADSEEFEISAFTLPGHEAYFADIRQGKKIGGEVAETVDKAKATIVPSAEELAAEAIAATNSVEVQLSQRPIAMAQQLRQRRFSKKKAAEKPKTADRERTLFADGVYSQADGPEGLGASAAPQFGIDESPAVKQNVEALFPNKQDSDEPKGNYLLLIRNASQ
jgi:hypothetical protein